MDTTLRENLSGIIVESVQDIFLAYLSIDASPGPSKIQPEDVPYLPPDAEVTAVVGYSGAIKGGIHLAAPRYVATKLAESFAGVALEEMSDEVRDAFGELANMVAGGLQTRLMEDHGLGEINLTPPMVVTGDQQRMTYQKNLSSVKQYFKFAGGIFFAECFFVPGG